MCERKRGAKRTKSTKKREEKEKEKKGNGDGGKGDEGEGEVDEEEEAFESLAEVRARDRGDELVAEPVLTVWFSKREIPGFGDVLGEGEEVVVDLVGGEEDDDGEGMEEG